MNPEEIRSIVEQVLDEKKEKGQLSQEIAELRKGIKDANDGLAGLKRLFCTADGKACFPTQVELNAHLEKQATKMEGIEAKIGEVIKISEAKPAPPGEPGLVGFAKEDDFNRLSEEQRQRLKGQINKLIPHPMLLDILKECSHSDSPEKCLLLKSVLKDYDAGEILAELPEEKRGKAVLLGCEDGACRVQLGKKIRIYKQDEKGKWKWIDEPKEEAKKGGFEIF